MKFCDNAGDPLHFPTPLPDCLCHVSFSRYWSLSVEVVKNRTIVKVFLAANIFSGGTTPTFLRHIVRAAYCWPFDKMWLSSVCWSPLVHSISCWNCKNRASVDKSMIFSAEIPKVVQIKMGYGGKLSVHVCSVKILASFDHPQKRSKHIFSTRLVSE